MEKQLESYIQNWQEAEGIKPINEQVFYDLFLEFIKTIDANEIDFDGNGSYFGSQVSIYKDRNYTYRPYLYFEISYEIDHKISIYTGVHSGFWTPEYIRMTPDDDRFNLLQSTLIDSLAKAFGLKKRPNN